MQSLCLTHEQFGEMFAQSWVLKVLSDLGPLKFKHIHEAEVWKPRKLSLKTTDHPLPKLGKSCVLQRTPGVEEQWTSADCMACLSFQEPCGEDRRKG